MGACCNSIGPLGRFVMRTRVHSIASLKSSSGRAKRSVRRAPIHCIPLHGKRTVEFVETHDVKKDLEKEVSFRSTE
jgi:hypothetical protein